MTAGLIGIEEFRAAENGQAPVRRELHGLRFPAITLKGSLLAQVGGGIATLTGVWMQFGVAAALMAGGVASVVLGMLREDGKV